MPHPESHLMDALAAWFAHPAVVAAEPRGMPVRPYEHEEAERLAARGALVLLKEPGAWYARLPESGAAQSPLST